MVRQFLLILARIRSRQFLLTLFRVEEVYLAPPPKFFHKIRTAIDFFCNLFDFMCLKLFGTNKLCYKELRHVSRCLVEGASHFRLLFERLLENEPKNNMYLCVKTLKLDNIPSIRYKMR